jgi:hypothetical protein
MRLPRARPPKQRPNSPVFRPAKAPREYELAELSVRRLCPPAASRRRGLSKNWTPALLCAITTDRRSPAHSPTLPERSSSDKPIVAPNRY